MAAAQRNESRSGTSLGYQTAGSPAMEFGEVGAEADSAIGATMRNVRKRTRERDRESRIETRTVQRPVASTTTEFPLRAHRPRTSHVFLPLALVVISASSGVAEPAARVDTFHVRREVAVVGRADAP